MRASGVDARRRRTTLVYVTVSEIDGGTLRTLTAILKRVCGYFHAAVSCTWLCVHVCDVFCAAFRIVQFSIEITQYMWCWWPCGHKKMECDNVRCASFLCYSSVASNKWKCVWGVCAYNNKKGTRCVLFNIAHIFFGSWYFCVAYPISSLTFKNDFGETNSGNENITHTFGKVTPYVISGAIHYVRPISWHFVVHTHKICVFLCVSRWMCCLECISSRLWCGYRFPSDVSSAWSHSQYTHAV